MRSRMLLLRTCSLLLLGALAVPAIASAQGRIVVGVGFGYGPVYRPWGGFYGPYGPYGPYPAPYFGAAWPYPVYEDLSGSLRVDVKPREAEVFVDGYYAGTVDDFDGVFQRLRVEPGAHDLELYLPGSRSVRKQVYLQPGKTLSLRLTMEPLQPGDPAPVRPSGGTPPAETPSGQSSRPVPSAPGDAIEPIDRPDTYGRVSILVQPGDAVVLIDGEQWLRPDGQRLVVELAPGNHVIEIQRDGYRSYITEITVRQSETTTLNVSLTAR